MDKIGAIGLGRLGLCFALTLERAGYTVIGYDIDSDRLQSIANKTIKTREPDVEKYLQGASRLFMTSSLTHLLEDNDVIFVTVRTDSHVDGKFDHSQFEKLIEDIIERGYQSRTKYLIVCSNVMPGYSDTVHKRLQHLNYRVSYSPELVAQGKILADQKSPDMVIIGEEDKESGDIIERIYRNVCRNTPKIHRMSRRSAELFKVALNCYMTTKITFANIIGDAAVKFGAEPDKILSALGDDSRIGKKYFSHGFGYGGPCFPRDGAAFIQFAKDINIDPLIIDAVIESNKLHLKYQIEEFCDKHPIDYKVIMPYVSFKPGSSIITESQQLLFAVELAKRGYKIIVQDHPEVIAQVKKLYGDLFLYEEKIS